MKRFMLDILIFLVIALVAIPVTSYFVGTEWITTSSNAIASALDTAITFVQNLF